MQTPVTEKPVNRIRFTLYSLYIFLLSANTVLAQSVEWNDMPLTDHTWFETESGFMQGEYEIPLAAGTWLEYKLGIEKGDMIVYRWTVDMADPSLLEVEFHGHTEPVDGKGDLMFYKVHNEGAEQGSLRAPFSGIHGWYLNNTSDEDIIIKLRVAGFYSQVQ